MLLRPARATDLAQIADLQIESWRNAYRGLLPETYLGAPVARDLSQLWQPDRLRALDVTVATDRQVLGFVSVRPEEAGAYLDNLHVRPQAQGQGIGRGLMAAAARSAMAQGASRLWLTVITGNTQARGFYARCGGVEGPAHKTDLFGTQVEVVSVTWTDLAALAAV